MSSVLQPSADLVIDAATVATIQGDDSRFQLSSVVLDYENAGADALVDIVVGTFTLPVAGGVFTTHVPWTREWDVELGATITLFVDQIMRVYAA